MTGYSDKTTVKAIRVLKELGIIDVAKHPKGPNHTYTLFMTGDVASWNKYLDSKAHVIEGMHREKSSTSKTSTSIYNNIINSKFDKVDKKGVLLSDDKSSDSQSPQNSNVGLGENLHNIPPGKRVTALEKFWIDTIPKYFKELKVVIKNQDKWVLDELYNKYESKLPLFEVLEYSIANWYQISKYAKAHETPTVAKEFPAVPDLSYLAGYVDYAAYLYVQSKEEV